MLLGVILIIFWAIISPFAGGVATTALILGVVIFIFGIIAVIAEISR